MSKLKQPKSITIVTLPIETPNGEANECAMDDKILIAAICEYRKQIEREGIEVYSRYKNILATEKGYLIAFFEEDLRNMEGGIDNPTPYKGKDGRMKVIVVKEGGEKVEQDLANLVGMRYCPNPNDYKKIWMRDANPENCTADNLYYCSNIRYFILRALHKIGIKIKNQHDKEWIH